MGCIRYVRSLVLYKHRKTIIIILACASGFSCAAVFPVVVDGKKGPGVEAESTIRELFIRNAFYKDSPDSVYVSFGFENGKHMDPPSEWIARLSDLTCDIRPASRYSEDAYHSGLRWEELPRLIEIRIAAWISDSEAVVTWQWYHGPLETAWHGKRRVRWSNGRWKMEKSYNKSSIFTAY